MQDGSLGAQLASKEREWKELQTQCIQQLEGALQEAGAQLSAERARFLQLKDDFQFNLRVLEERDRELERYDAAAARLWSTESARQAEASELRIQIAKLQESAAEEARNREALQEQYQRQAAEHRLQLERLQSLKGGDIQRHREEYEALKRELERRIREVECELALQKQELMADFDSEMQRREHEFNLRADEMSSVVLSHELKGKLLSKELEAHVRAHSQATEALTEAEERCRSALKEVQRREWEIQDVTAVKNARIKELEDRLSTMEANSKREEQVFNRKHEELDRCVRDREAALAALKGAHAERLRQEEARFRELQAERDAMLAERRRLDWSHADALKDKEEQLEKLRAELETTKAGWDAHVLQASKAAVSRDVELHTLGEREAKLRAEVQRRQEEVERYKQELAHSVQREQALEQARVQVQLDWQRRCEDAQASHYLKSEELIQGLTQARDQVTAELREKERELQDMAKLLRSLALERDQALQGPHGDPSRDAQSHGAAGTGSFPSDEIQRLQQQNRSLRSVVAEMRKDMESLSERPLAPPSPPETPAQSAPAVPAEGSADYARALEEEIGELKARCRRLEEQLEEARGAPGPSPPAPFPSLPVSSDNAYMQNHIRSLNETIGGLRAEKVSSAAAQKKQEVRVAHLEAALAQLTQQFHSKQVESDELRFELANQKRRGATEEAGLRQRLSTVEMELAEVKREAEEYQKGSLLQNLEAVSLGNQVSALKLDIASRREPIVIEQGAATEHLQEENLRLRKQLLSGHGGAGTEGGTGAPLLRAQLKKAVRRIAQLTRDKDQLIEMGNRLRAQLAEAGRNASQLSVSGSEPRPIPGSPVPEGRASEGGARGQRSRLSTLEHLQYKLTSQELQYAQLETHKGTPIKVQALQLESESEDRSQLSQRDSRYEHASEKKENTPPDLRLSETPLQVEPVGHRSGLGRSSRQSQPLMSSLGSEGSLQDIWQMLDEGSSVLTPSDGAGRGEECERKTGGGSQASDDPDPGHQVRVQGTRAPVQQRTKPTRPSAKPAKQPRAPGRIVNVRNYNIKN